MYAPKIYKILNCGYNFEYCIFISYFKVHHYVFIYSLRLKRITAEVDEEQEQAQKKKLKRLQRREKKLREPGRVCKHKFNPCDEASFTLAGELCGSLREMIPVGNVLKDRFLNMQKRNLIEVMKPQFK